MIRPLLHTHGFTLLESLIAVAILALAISGPLYAANRAIVVSKIASDRLTASYLAQEGIEEIRKMRDDEYLTLYKASQSTAPSWTNFTNSISECAGTYGCTMDPWNGPLTFLNACNLACTDTLYSDDNTKQYSLTSGVGKTKTPFVRSIKVTAISANEVSITSVVSWLFQGTAYTITISDHLMPWLP